MFYRRHTCMHQRYMRWLAAQFIIRVYKEYRGIRQTTIGLLATFVSLNFTACALWRACNWQLCYKYTYRCEGKPLVWVFRIFPHARVTPFIPATRLLCHTVCEQQRKSCVASSAAPRSTGGACRVPSACVCAAPVFFSATPSVCLSSQFASPYWYGLTGIFNLVWYRDARLVYIFAGTRCRVSTLFSDQRLHVNAQVASDEDVCLPLCIRDGVRARYTTTAFYLI